MRIRLVNWHPASRPSFLLLTRFWHTWERFCMNQGRFVWSMRCTLLGYNTCSFEHRPNSLPLGSTGSVITIGLSINGCSNSKKTVDKREQNWLVQKFGLRQLPRHEAIQAEPLFLPITQEDKRSHLLTWLLGATGIEYSTGCLNKVIYYKYGK